MTRATPIVLLHGWGFTSAVWTDVVDALAQQHVQRNCILTPEIPLAVGQNITHTLSTLGASFPEHAHLVGWSLGGELALAMTQAMPQRVASLTMISSTPCFMNQTDWALGQPISLLDDFDQRLVANPAALLKRFAMLARHGDAEASRDHDIANQLSQAQESDPERLAAGLQLLRQIDLRTAASGVATPSLLIHGAADAVVPIAAAEWLRQQCRATLQQIDGASHALPLTHAVLLAEQLADFVGRNA